MVMGFPFRLENAKVGNELAFGGVDIEVQAVVAIKKIESARSVMMSSSIVDFTSSVGENNRCFAATNGGLGGPELYDVRAKFT